VHHPVAEFSSLGSDMEKGSLMGSTAGDGAQGGKIPHYFRAHCKIPRAFPCGEKLFPQRKCGITESPFVDAEI